MKTIELSSIKISNAFLNTKPSEKKVQKVLKYIEKNGRIDKQIILYNGVLVDNYIRYLAASINNFNEVPYVELREMTYIVGKHNRKEYIWKNDRNIDIEIGDKVLVRIKHNGKNKKTCVTVVDVFSSDDLNLYNKHKSVVKKLKNNN